MRPTTTGTLSEAKQRLLQKYLSGQPRAETAAKEPGIPKRSLGNVVPQSYPQEQVWTHAQIQAGGPSYNEVITLYRHGPLDIAVLERCLNEIVRRHEIWRTTFDHSEEGPLQIVHDRPPPVQIPVSDLRNLRDHERRDTSFRLATENARLPINLRVLPLWHLHLVRLADEEYQLHMSLHQMIMDGVTVFRNFLPEVIALYDAFSRGQPSPLPEPALQYADFAAWQRQSLNDRSLASDLAYWKQQLAGELPMLHWPIQRPRPARQTFLGSTETRHLQASLIDPLKRRAEQESASLFMALTAGFVALLYRYTGQEDIILGTPSANRIADTEGMYGYFINMLPLRIDVSGEPTFRELLRRVRQVVADALSHGRLPFLRLLREIKIPLDPSRNPLFQVMITLEPTMPSPSHQWDLSQAEVSSGGTKVDLDLSMESRADGVMVPLMYNPDLMDAATMLQTFYHWETLLKSAVENPDLPITRLQVMTPAEQQTHRLWNQTEQPIPDGSVIALFEAQVRLAPEAIALVFAERQLTYAELNCQANQVAHHLIRAGAAAETRIGICLNRSHDLLIVLLGILKTGAAYVPLDPDFPEARLAAMLEDAHCPILVTQASLQNRFQHTGARLILCDQNPTPWSAEPVTNPPARAGGDNLAYVLFTSGSTGRPKGVEIEHRSLVNLLVAFQREIDFREIDTLLAVTTISFDIAGLELFLPLVSGGRVVMASRAAAADGMALAALLDQHQVTVLQATPSTWRLLVESGWSGKSDLRALTGGEALPPDLARSLTHRARVVWNVYGPTETTIWSSIYRVTGEEDRTIPIGRPIANTQFHVLDARQEPVPAGYFGELYIGGDGLARGYLNRPEQTAERFVTCPVDPDSQRRLYRTGDLVRHLPDGLLEFQGRLDQQVKVRGFRIELGDIEAALTQDPAVASAAVVVLQVGGENELAAFIVARAEESVRAESLRDSLGRVLPGYMVPSRFYTVDALPLTPNGKVDRRALANRGGTELTPSSTCEAPRTEAERELAELWKAVLRRDRVGIHDNFFALGGHSLLALQLLSRMRAIWSCDVPMRLLFDFPTIAELAARRPHLASSPSESPSIPLVAAVRNGPLPVSPTQERLWFLDRLDPESTAYLIADAIHLTGALDVPALERALREIIVRHESLRTVFRDTESGAIQVATPIPDTVLEYEDLSGLDTPQRASAMATHLDKATGRRFDLAQGPLYRFQLLQLAPEEHLFLITLHHMVADGWSLGIFNHELGILYNAFRDAKPSPLPPLPFQYADYAVWQRSRLQGDPLKRLLDYWTRRLDGAPPLLELPLDGPRIRSGRARAAIRTLTLPTDLSTAILGLSQRSGVTPFMLLLAAFKVLLSRLSGQHDIVVGTPIAGRTQVATEPMIGFFVSTIALRTDLTGNPSFRGLLERVRTTVLEAQEHQNLPFEKLIERLQPDRTAPHNPVFQVLFNLINFENDLPALGQLGVRRYRQPEPDAKFDLTLYVMSQPGSLGFQASYPTHLFHDATIERILEQLKYLLEQHTREPEAAIQGLSLIRPADLSLLPNATAPLPAIPQPAIHEAVQTQARRYPQRLAVSDPHHQWTYGELETASNRLANHLLASGLRRGETVAVFAISSVHLAQSLLGILKAGGVFLVLDAAQPEARLRRMLDQSQPSGFLHVEAGGDLPKEVRDFAASPALRCSMALPSGLPVNAGDEAPPLVIGGDDPAYVVFTSGSTGQPLGILGNHGPVSHFLSWHLNRFQLAESDRFSLLSGPGHDPLLRDLFAPLWAGASVHIPPTDIRQSPRRMQSWFEEQGITVSHLTPALAQVLASVGTGDTPRLQSVRWMFLAGDRLTGTVVHALRQCVPRSGIVNFYGTTETPQAMAHHVVVQPGEDSPISIRPDEAVPLGRPIDDVQLLLINPAGQLAGIGELAEIGIRTPYLGRSYLGSDELSRTRFILNPFTGQASDRVYRTGDWGRYRLDGTVEFVGRMDGQIKVRGYRVEPDEVARALRQHPAVQDCTVTGGIELGAADSIVAYLLLRNDVDRPDRSQLRAFLKAVLPEAMIPARFLVIEAIPLTPNGKVDRRLLSRLRAVELETGNAGVSPRTETERQMLDVWREALGRPAAGIHDNFFELGGHSLLVLRLVTLLHERLHLPITLADLFAHPTVAELASPDSASKNSSSARVFRGKGDGAPWFHIPGVYGLEFLTPSIADQVGRHRRFYDGLQFPGLDGRTEPVTTVPAIADSLVGQINTLWPEGPLCLSGYSMGGLVAYEVAQQLQAAGRTVERLILFDTRLLYLARRKSVPQQLKVLLQRFRDEPAQRRWSWLRDLLRAKFLQHGRRLARRLGSGPRNQQERMEIAGWTASAAYRPEPYSGKVTLLRSTRMGELDSGAWERDAVNGWGPFLHPSFEIRNIDCDHERTFLDPVSPEVLRVVEELVRPLA